MITEKLYFTAVKKGEHICHLLSGPFIDRETADSLLEGQTAALSKSCHAVTLSTELTFEEET